MNKKLLGEYKKSNRYDEKRLYYSVTGNWEEAEDDPHWEIRLEAFRNTGNWEKAENDSFVCIRLEALRHIQNWVEN